MNLVVGSTGTLGAEICRTLRARGRPVRALVRATSDRVRVQVLQSLGAEVFVGDLRDATSLAHACAGVRTVISATSAISSTQPDNTIIEVDATGQITLARTALHSGVRRFIFISVSSSFSLNCALIDAKRAVENHLLKSGIGFTILRPSAFMETWFGPVGGFDIAHRRARLLGDIDAGVSYVSASDVAKFAAMSAENSALCDQVLELGGPEILTAKQVVRMYEELLGERFAVSCVPIEELEAAYTNAADPVQKSFAALMLGVARGDAIPMQSTLALFNQRFTNARSFLHRNVKLAVTA